MSVVDNFYSNAQGLLLCEQDHYRRLDLLCHTCQKPLKDQYIKARDLKFHLEHFTCSQCPLVFQQNDSYYERDGQFYCPEHYGSLFAFACQGCTASVLSNYVESKMDGGDVEKWHPNCYMIYKVLNSGLLT